MLPSLTEYDENTRTVTMEGKPLKVQKISADLGGCITTPIISEKMLLFRHIYNRNRTRLLAKVRFLPRFVSEFAHTLCLF